MDIENFIKQEAGNDNEHDRNYAAALRNAHILCKDMTHNDLIDRQIAARRNYKLDGNTHKSTAMCMIVMELLTDLDK